MGKQAAPFGYFGVQGMGADCKKGRAMGSSVASSLAGFLSTAAPQGKVCSLPRGGCTSAGALMFWAVGLLAAAPQRRSAGGGEDAEDAAVEEEDHADKSDKASLST